MRTNQYFKWKELAIIIVPFLLINKFFNCKLIVESALYSQFLSLFYLGLLCWTIPTIFQKYEKKSISISIKYIIFVLVCSILAANLISEQNLYGSLRAIGPSLTLCVFFLFVKNKVSSRSIIQAFIILIILYTVIYIFTLLTFPYNMFGYSESLIERADIDLRNRGIIRIGVPGADFVILGIFYVLNLRYENRKYLLWLIPLFILLIMRGTRTPLFVTILLSSLYLIITYKHKIIIFLAVVVLYISVPVIYDTLLNSKSDNIIVNYVKMTDKQISGQSEDDIRLQMAEYYLFDYNKNLLPIIFGNGVPFGTSAYGKKIMKNNISYSYYMEDVGYVQLFVHYGLIGVVIYLLGLVKVLRTSVDSKYEFAKLFVIYYFLVSMTGAYIITNAMMLAFGLYLMEIHRKKEIGNK